MFSFGICVSCLPYGDIDSFKIDIVQYSKVVRSRSLQWTQKAPNTRNDVHVKSKTQGNISLASGCWVRTFTLTDQNSLILLLLWRSWHNMVPCMSTISQLQERRKGNEDAQTRNWECNDPVHNSFCPIPTPTELNTMSECNVKILSVIEVVSFLRGKFI